MPRPGQPLLAVLLLAGCHRPLPPPSFPEHAEVHQKAEYARGAGAVAHVGKLRTNHGRRDYLRELDAYVVLLGRIQEARRRVLGHRLPAGAPEEHRQALREEEQRLAEEAGQVAKLVREFLDLGVGSKLVEVIPELEEALRLAGGAPPVPGLDVQTLRERQRLLGTGPARCGAESPDIIGGPDPPPPFWIMARDHVDETGQDIIVTAEQRERFARILGASKPQRQAMGQYGPFESIRKGKGGSEIWRFRIGSVEQSATGSRAADYRPRAVIIDCEFDRRGQLVAGTETVLDETGEKFKL